MSEICCGREDALVKSGIGNISVPHVSFQSCSSQGANLKDLCLMFLLGKNFKST